MALSGIRVEYRRLCVVGYKETLYPKAHVNGAIKKNPDNNMRIKYRQFGTEIMISYSFALLFLYHQVIFELCFVFNCVCVRKHCIGPG